MAVGKDKDLEKFLKDVDEVTNLVQALNSKDPSLRDKAMYEVDQRLATKEADAEVEGCRTKVNKTSINPLPTSQSSPSLAPSSNCPSGFQNMEERSQDSFLAALEQDASERAKKRKENEVLANALKDMGNEAFAKGDYETAVLRYTEGLDRLKDMQVLYTNRAQAHIKLEKYKEAINDCEWALRCNETCAKAYVHMGKAYLGLKDYDEARKWFRKIVESDPKQEKLAKGYLTQVDFQEQKAIQEEKAQEEFALGKETAVSVKDLLQKLSRPDQAAAYYAGGIRFLTAAIKDCTERTLFRTNNGFSIINENKVISWCLEKTEKDPLEVDLCIALTGLWQDVCKDNEINLRMLVEHPDMDGRFFNLLSSGVPDIQNECLAMLLHLSEVPNGKPLLIGHLDMPRLLECLLGFIPLSDARARIAMGLLAGLVVEEKFKIHLRSNFSKTSLPSILHEMQNVKLVTPAVLPEFVAVMLSLSLDADIRRQMSNSKECWEACLATLDECQLPSNEADCTDTIAALLSLMMSMALEPSPVIKERAVDVTQRCLTLQSSKNGEILTKTVGVLSRVLKHCSLAVDEAVRGGSVKKLMRFLKASGKITSGYAVKALAACTRSSVQAQEDMVKLDKKFSVLMKFLRSEDEVIAGNAALCLGYCVTVPGAASSLLKSDVLKILLTYARGDAKALALQQNAAIALGKLCTAEPRFVEQLRELHGIEILNSCMKYVEFL